MSSKSKSNGDEGSGIPGYYGNAEKVAQAMLDAFEQGRVAAPLATIWLDHADKPMNHWSWFNRFGCILMGCTDARGYKQWEKVGRSVRKGERAHAWILCPRLVTEEDEETGEKRKKLIGFIGQAVFDVSQTDGDELPGPDHSDFLEALPLVEVAETWEIKVAAADTAVAGALGRYRFGGNTERIELGVANLSTWLHELVHAADNRLGNLGDNSKDGHAATEAVAELGGAVLAHLTGHHEGADDGGCWAYISREATRIDVHPIKLVREVLDRTIQAVSLILETAGLDEPQAEQLEAA